MNNLIEELRRGKYNAGILGFLEDAKFDHISVDEARGIIVDFLECRVIEKK